MKEHELLDTAMYIVRIEIGTGKLSRDQPNKDRILLIFSRDNLDNESLRDSGSFLVFAAKMNVAIVLRMKLSLVEVLLPTTLWCHRCWLPSD